MKKTLTRAEEQVMHAVWDIGEGFLKDVHQAMPQPQPHSNTVATILKLLMEKGFVATKTYGRNNLYYSLVARESYTGNTLQSMVEGYFEGSFRNAVSFMVNNKQLSVNDLELLLKELKNQKQ